jgi:hypothetical protein
MKHPVLKVTFLICVFVAGFFLYKYLGAEKANVELQNLVTKSVQSVERENNSMYYDIQELAVRREYAKENPEIYAHIQRLEKLYKSDVDLETGDLDSLTKNLADKLALNDSLEEFSKGFTNCGGRTIGLTLMYFQHGSLFRYGDTAFYVYETYNSPYLMKNTYEIIGFTRHEFAEKIGNAVRFSLPTTKFMNPNEKQKDVDIDYKVFVKNIYTGKIDTVKENIRFKIYR